MEIEDIWQDAIDSFLQQHKKWKHFGDDIATSHVIGWAESILAIAIAGCPPDQHEWIYEEIKKFLPRTVDKILKVSE